MKSTTDTLQNAPYFDNHVLIANPSLEGSYFEKAVVYVYMHTHEGAMGVVINRPASDIQQKDVALQLGAPKSNLDIFPTVYLGGPLEAGKGAIIHTSDYTSYLTQSISSSISLTSTLDVIEDIIKGEGPKKSIFAVGYAGWGPNQLEKEIQEDSWTVLPADPALIFDIEDEAKWQYSAHSLGIDFSHYASSVGHG
jgi:putative transcriptional regulator